MEWIYLAKDRTKGRDLVNEVINLRLPQNDGNFLTSSGRFGDDDETLQLGYVFGPIFEAGTYRILNTNKR